MHGVEIELRQIWRGVVRKPSYSAVVILTLGLGIGATTTIYSVVDAMLIRALPYPDASRLVKIGNFIPGQEQEGTRDGLQRLEPISARNLEDLGRRTGALEKTLALTWSVRPGPDRGGGAGPEPMRLAMVSPGFFELLSVKPHIGRFPSPTEAWSSQSPSWGAMITYAVWQSRFGKDPKVLGTQLQIPGVTVSIVGVLPRAFHQPEALLGGSAPEFWTYLDLGSPRLQARDRREMIGLGKLKPGVTVERARSELAAAERDLARDEPNGNILPNGETIGVGANYLRDETIGTSGQPILIGLGAALLLLVLACANAANLLVVRGLEREGDLSVRRALGASRPRLIGGAVAESVCFALLGGIVGLGIAFGGVAAFRRFGPPLPRLAEVSVNQRIMLAGALLSGIVGLVIGIVPAVRSSGGDLMIAMRSSLNAMSHKGARLRTILATIQLALAVVLGIGASLLFRSFVEIRTANLGFEPANLTAFMVSMPKSDHLWELKSRLLDAVSNMPGVTQVGVASNLPFQTPDWTPRVERADRAGQSLATGIPGYVVSPTFFGAAAIRLIQGRSFDGSDQPDSRPVAIVNQSFVRATFADRNPIGARIRILTDDANTEPPRELEIVGVVGDVVQARVEDGVGPALYVPDTQGQGAAHVVVRSRQRPADLREGIRQAVAAVTPIPPADLSTMESRIAVTQTSPRFQLLLIGSFAAAAIVLSGIGLYGTLAFNVRARAKELGIRVAMGAGRGEIYRLVLRQGLRVLGVGLATGIAGAVGLTRLLQGFLFRITPVDPVAFLGAIAVVAAAVLVASLRPASRAARIDPVASMRLEG